MANDEGGLLKGAGVLLIGGTGGIGSALVERLLDVGAGTIVVASSQNGNVHVHPRVLSETVDVTDLNSVQALAARLASVDVSIVINSAGVNGNQRLFAPGAAKAARREMEVNYFGLMHVGMVFGERLVARGGGTLVNLLSFASYVNIPLMASYCASKAAAHSLTQALRAELRNGGVRVCGVYPTAVNTAMSRDQQGPKLDPATLAAEVIASVLRGDEDLLPGDAAVAYSALRQDPKTLEREMATTI